MNRAIENEYLYVEVSDRGAELMRIVRKDTNTEMLWNGDPQFWKYRSPILFPNVGRTYENKVKIDGKEYQTKQHGIAREMDFVCVEEQAEHLRYCLTSDEATRAYYPFDFALYISYTLQEKKILVKWEVENRSETKMHFTIGGHPAFMFEQAGEVKEDYELYFPGMERLTATAVDLVEGVGKPDQKYEVVLEEGSYPLSDQVFDVDTLVFDDAQVREVWLRKKESKRPYIGVHSEDFYSFGIWSLPKAPYVCLEPWAGRCDDEGFAEDISLKKGINEAKPGETWEKAYEILIG